MDINLITLAIEGSSILSKFRLILSKELISHEYVRKKLYAFPVKYRFDALDHRQKQYLQSKIVLNFEMYFLFYSIPYVKYQEYKKESKNVIINHNRFEVIKDYFTILKLKEMEKRKETIISISCREKIDFIKPLISVKEIINDDRLRAHGDALIEFKQGELKDKFPIFFVDFIFGELNLFGDNKIEEITTRDSVMGKNTGTKGIKRRNMILEEDKKLYNKVSNSSFSNLIALVDDKELFEKVNKNHKVFERYKKSDKYRETLEI